MAAEARDARRPSEVEGEGWHRRVSAAGCTSACAVCCMSGRASRTRGTTTSAVSCTAGCARRQRRTSEGGAALCRSGCRTAQR